MSQFDENREEKKEELFENCSSSKINEDFEDIDLGEAKVSTFMTPRGSISDTTGNRRVSRASFLFFQNETNLEIDPEQGLIGRDGKLRDEYILKRQSVNRPATLKTIPLLSDLTVEKLDSIDGWVLTELFLSGFARVNKKVDELNKINVFPIADGDTGANMKICLKLPVRNLLLDRSESILSVASNIAADVLLNGQGNSGTILSHFFVSLAEEIKKIGKESISIEEFSSCLVQCGNKMNNAVSNPVEGTLLSVARDACSGLANDAPYDCMKQLLKAWYHKSSLELEKTPNQLIVDGVEILKKAGVVDSGAQGFVYFVEGMYLASQGKLPEARDPALFKTASIFNEDISFLDVDDTVCDSKYQFCTEAVINLKEGIEKENIIDLVAGDDLGDSIVCVCAPAKEGGNMAKVHIHTNEPEQIFQNLRTLSRESILKKEKVDDMFAMREQVKEGEIYLDDSKFTILGMSSHVLPQNIANDLMTLPVFMVPSSTQEPIDIRYSSCSDTCNALNLQRHASSAIRYTTAASNPMQIKIELLTALGKGKPVLVFLMSKDKRVSALGRNVMTAIDMLLPEQKEKVKVLVHGWGFYEAIFLREAIRCAQEGKTIDEAHKEISELAARNFCFNSFVSSCTIRKLMSWRPGLFPTGLSVKDNQFYTFGIPPVIREGEPLSEFQRIGSLMNIQAESESLLDAQDKEIQRLKNTLKPGQYLASLTVQCAGRVDFGYNFVEKLKAAKIPIKGKVLVYKMGFLSVATSSWGEMLALYNVVDES